LAENCVDGGNRSPMGGTVARALKLS
jgi:hypothetical protein